MGTYGEPWVKKDTLWNGIFDVHNPNVISWDEESLGEG